MRSKSDSKKANNLSEYTSTLAEDGRKIRVVHVTSLGSTARCFLLEHFSRLRAAGFDVIFVCCDGEDARYCAQATGVHFISVGIKQNVAPFSDFVSLLRLWRLFRQLRPVIVDSHMSKAGLLGSLAGWLARVPIRIYHNHGMALLSSRGCKHLLLRVTELVACRCATEVIFVSPSNMEDAINIGICPEKKAVVLGPGTICGVDTNKFDPQKASPHGAKLRQEAGIPEESWLVGFVGRIIPHKGVETVIEAWRLLLPDIRSRGNLCIFGAPEHWRMQDLVEQAASEPELHVKYMGYSSDMPAWYSTMTLLVQPSWHEGWGYNVLEAACFGVPAVGTRISATVDAILDGKTGLLVPVKDPQMMADAITRLLKNGDLRRRLGQAARERTINEFSHEKICPLLTEEYQRLLRCRKQKIAAIIHVKQTKSNLNSERVLIRELRLSDAKDIYLNIRDKEIDKWTKPLIRPYPGNAMTQSIYRVSRYTWKALRLIWEAACPPKTKKEVKLGIVLKETGRVIGVVSLKKIDLKSKCAEIGFWIGKKYWGKGLATEAVRPALKFGFTELELDRIYAWTFEKNIGSRKVMEKCGLKVEKMVSDAYPGHAEKRNILNYGILKSECEM